MRFRSSREHGNVETVPNEGTWYTTVEQAAYKGPSKSFRLAQSTGLRMKAARSWRRKGTSGRPDRWPPLQQGTRLLATPQHQPGHQTSHDQQHHGKQGDSRLVAAKRLYSTIQIGDI